MDSASPTQALSGVKILDLSQEIAGPYCARLLADYGADVIKIEPPHGDRARRCGPFFKDSPHPEKSSLFMHLNTNKRGMTLNLESAAGVRILKRLVKDSHVLVESLGPGGLERHGIPFRALRELNPALVVTSISDFGQTGPYRDYKGSELLYYAMGGPMYGTGDLQREPMKTGDDISQFQVGAAAAVSTMMAFYRAEATGEGDHIDISMMEVMLGSIDRRAPRLLSYQYTGVVGERNLDTTGRIGGGIHQCSDGWVSLQGGEYSFAKICSLIGMPDLLQDPRFSTPKARMQAESIRAFEEYLDPWLANHTRAEAWRMAQEARIPSGVVNSVEDLLADANFRERGVWEWVEHPVVGQLAQPGRPFIMQETPWRMRSPAPTPGQHNREVLCGELGYSRSDLMKLRETGAI